MGRQRFYELFLSFISAFVKSYKPEAFRSIPE